MTLNRAQITFYCCCFDTFSLMLSAVTWGVHLVWGDAASYHHRLRGAEAPKPRVCPWRPQVRHVRPVPYFVSELQYRADDHLHCVRYQEQRSSWDIQWSQTHRLHHVHDLHHLAGLCTHFLWHGTVYRKGGKFDIFLAITVYFFRDTSGPFPTFRNWTWPL